MGVDSSTRLPFLKKAREPFQDLSACGRKSERGIHFFNCVGWSRVGVGDGVSILMTE